MKDCRYFLQGRCMKGISCPFRHDPLAISSSPATPDDARLTTGRRDASGSHHALRNRTSETPCLIFQNAPTDGSGLETQSVPAAPTQPPRDWRSSIPCKYYLHGTCRNEENCPYAHSNEIKAGSGCQETTHFNDERERDGFPREFSGAFAQFQDGCQILKIALPGDFSAIRINGLPLDSTQISVSALIRDLGFQVDPALVRISRSTEAATFSADVKVEDPTFAERFCAKLKSDIEILPARYSSLEALPVSPPTLSGSLSRRVSCKKVHISWHKPTRPAWLDFENKDIAKSVGNKFNEGTYKIFGQMARADPPKHCFYRDNYNRHSVGWRIMLNDIPYISTSNDVKNSIQLKDDKPRRIEMGKFEHFCDPGYTSRLVRLLFADAGSVTFEMNAQSEGKRFKAAALFEGEADARVAVQSLHDKPQEFLDEGKLTVQLISSAKFKIPTTIYDILEEQLSTKSVEWRERYLQFKVYRNTDALQRFTTLKIEGEQAKDVANATNTLEDILTGQTVTDGHEPVWGTAFTGNGDTYQKLKQIEQHHGVVIIRNKAKKQLKFLGPPEKYHEVQRTIVELIRTESTTVQTIRLNAHEFRWACNGGFKQIVTVLGDDVASFDIVSKPRKVIITGSKKQYQTALNIIRGNKGDVKRANLANTDQACTICWTEAENPLLTSCNHLYCLQCFEDLCMSSMSAEKGSPICCQGEMGTCRKMFSLHEIQNHLSSAAFEEILEASFVSYIRRHPEDFRYCPTPDCGYIYRTSVAAGRNTCIKCLEIICTACHQQHGIMTCADYKDLISGGFEALQKYKKEKGIKDCPRCATILEKIDGCNHMICGGCGAHICWVCLKLFTTGGQCYAHMRYAHQGIGLDYFDL